MIHVGRVPSPALRSKAPKLQDDCVTNVRGRLWYIWGGSWFDSLPTLLLTARGRESRQEELALPIAAQPPKVEEIFAMRKLLLICLALCVMFMLVGVTFAADSTTVNGIVSDSKCRAKNAGTKGAECTKERVKKGAKLVVVTDGDQKVIALDNPAVLSGHEGHHVAVTGTVTGESMHVDRVKMIEKSAMYR